jgi:hypothetical protein
MKIKLLFAMFCFSAYLNAQITTNEQPYSMSMRSSLSDVSVHKEVKEVTAAKKTLIAQEDLINDTKPGPERYAFDVPVNYNLENSGTWQDLPDGGRLWRLKVEMKGALSTNAYYEQFWLPKGAKFFVYSEETGQFIGAITSEFIEGSQKNPTKFATALIYGENVVFEYYQPSYVKLPAIISISHIGYGYRFVDKPQQIQLRNFGDANSCHININSSTGANWQQYEKHAVAKVSVHGPNGSGWCSCALVNNTSNNYTPYVLTADHCLAGLDAISNNNASQFMFYWEYENSGNLNNALEPIVATTTGATVKANNSYTDFALLQLTQDPRNNSSVFPYYLGWDRATSVSGEAVGIHHPKGDVKKISQMNQIYGNNYTINWSDGTANLPQTHWVAYIHKGFTEGGSSGSPLINSSHKVVGQLHGSEDYDSCTPKNAFYGRFDKSWTGNNAADSRRRLSDWLDPTGSNPQTLNGIAYNTTNSFFTGSIITGSKELWFTQYYDGPLYVCPGSFTMNFKSNKTNLTFSSSGPGSYSFSNLGSGYYSLIGTFSNHGSISFFNFSNGTSSCGLTLYVECDRTYSDSSPISDIDLNTDRKVAQVNNEYDDLTSALSLSGSQVSGVSGAISIYTETNIQVCVYNINGKIIIKQPVNAGTTRINLPSGLYFVTLENSSHKVLVK